MTFAERVKAAISILRGRLELVADAEAKIAALNADKEQAVSERDGLLQQIEELAGITSTLVVDVVETSEPEMVEETEVVEEEYISEW